MIRANLKNQTEREFKIMVDWLSFDLFDFLAAFNKCLVIQILRNLMKSVNVVATSGLKL